MKAYTDIEQSKKLAEILPIESANMFYDQYGVIRIGNPKERYSDYHQLPVWSLAALIDVLPDESDIVKGKLDVVDYKYMCTVCIKEEVITVFDDNLLDACYEVILKLNELKML